MGADLKTLSRLWTGLFNSVSLINDENERRSLRDLLEERHSQMIDIADSEVPRESKLAQYDALSKPLLEIQEKIHRHLETQYEV